MIDAGDLIKQAKSMIKAGDGDVPQTITPKELINLYDTVIEECAMRAINLMGVPMEHAQYTAAMIRNLKVDEL